MKKLNKKQDGFTIIEVLIVLAIAGLIMLIVFLAVPALQRNSRNTNRRGDVARILGATQEVINNNNGVVSSVTTANIQAATGTLGYYGTGNVTAKAYAGGDANGTTTDTVVVETGATCGANGQPISGTTRQVVALFTVETGNSGSTPICQSS